MREINYIELMKLQSSCIEQDMIMVTERLEARIEVAIDLKVFPRLLKKVMILSLSSYTGISTSS